jgi:hypothetical protein
MMAVGGGVAALAAAGWAAPSGKAAQPRPAAVRSAIEGTASVSGTVSAPRPFKAAQVYLRNVDRLMGYMVFTSGGLFRATALLPGNYEVTVKTKDLASQVQKLALKAGDSRTVDLSLRETSANQAAGGALNEAAGTSLVDGNRSVSSTVGFRPYEDMYVDNGPGKQVAEQVCMACHGENFLPTQPANEATWAARIDHMQGRILWDRDATSYAQGLLSYRASMFRFSRNDRDDLLKYLVTNFGPDAQPRAVMTEDGIPVDEETLGTAMYIEYYLPPDQTGEGTKSPEYIKVGPYGGRRVGQDVRFDNEGNVWLTDRGFPHRLVRLDPRTGEQ